jgi:hypothetical protein
MFSKPFIFRNLTASNALAFTSIGEIIDTENKSLFFEWREGHHIWQRRKHGCVLTTFLSPHKMLIHSKLEKFVFADFKALFRGVFRLTRLIESPESL